MANEELLRILKQATIALEQYRLAQRTKTASTDRNNLIRESAQRLIIKNAVDSLVKEAYMLGPSGNICPRCGGSGRI